MSLSDKAKQLADKAKDYAATHKDQVTANLDKVEAAVDTHTGGKYHDKIEEAGKKADAFVDKLPSSTSPTGATDPASGDPLAGVPVADGAAPQVPDSL